MKIYTVFTLYFCQTLYIIFLEEALNLVQGQRVRKIEENQVQRGEGYYNYLDQASLTRILTSPGREREGGGERERGGEESVC